jgi:hypothetical protein
VFVCVAIGGGLIRAKEVAWWPPAREGLHGCVQRKQMYVTTVLFESKKRLAISLMVQFRRNMILSSIVSCATVQSIRDNNVAQLLIIPREYQSINPSCVLSLSNKAVIDTFARCVRGLIYRYGFTNLGQRRPLSPQHCICRHRVFHKSLSGRVCEVISREPLGLQKWHKTHKFCGKFM